MKSSGLSSLKNEEVKSLLEEIKNEFITLREYVVVSYQHDETSPYVKRFDNLFKGFRDWANNPKRTPFINPAKIYDCNAKIKEFDRKHLSTVYRSMEELGLKIRDIYSKNYNYTPKIIFDIEAAQRGGRGRYRLKVTIDGKDLLNSIEIITAPRTVTKRIQQPPQNQTHLLKEYLKQVKEDYRYLDTKHLNMIPFPDNTIELDRAYIHLKAIGEVPLSEASHLTEDMRYLSGVPESFIEEKRVVAKPSVSPRLIEQILHQNSPIEQNSPKRHMVFLGLPGSGKSTLLRYLAHSVASSKADAWGLKGFVPFFIDLREYSRSGCKDIIRYSISKATENIGSEGKRDIIKKILGEVIDEYGEKPAEDCGLMFLLDALDETSDEKGGIVTQIERLRNRYQDAFIIVTSRITGYYECPLNGFALYLLKDLQVEEVNHFITEWFRILAEGKSRENPERDWNTWVKDRTDYLLREIDHKPGLKYITTSPLYLTFLVLLASEPDTTLPETRLDLFDTYFRKLLFNWEKKHVLPGIKYGKELLFKGFVEISDLIHRSIFGDINNDPTEGLVINHIGNSLAIDADQCLDFWVKAGIFQKVGTRDRKELILPRHLSFVEYGFACKLADLWDSGVVREKIWKALPVNLRNCYLYEPLILFAGKINDPTKFLKMVLDLKDDLFHGNLIFAARAYIELQDRRGNERIGKEIARRMERVYNSQEPWDKWPLGIELIRIIGKRRDSLDILRLYKKERTRAIRWLLLKGLRISGDGEAIALVKKILEDEDDKYLRMEGAITIGKLGGEDGIPLLVKQFMEEAEKEFPHSNTVIKTEIIEGISDIGGKEAIESLKQLSEIEKDVGVAVKIANAFCRLGEKKLGISLLNRVCGRREDNDNKLEMALGMIAMGDSSGLEVLKDIYFDTKLKTDEVEKLTGRVARIKERQVKIDLLKGRLGIEEDASLKARIALEIAKSGDNSTISLVKEHIEKVTDVTTKMHFLRGLADAGDTSCFKSIRELWKSSRDPNIKTDVVHCAEKSGDKQFIPLLKAMFEEEQDPYERMYIARAIGLIGEPLPAINILQKIYRQEEDLSLREEVAESIYDICFNSKILIYKVNKHRWKYLQTLQRYHLFPKN